jgi:hypothetical protein
MYQKVCRNTIKNECVKVFETEKDKLKKVLKNIDRISLTYDCWTSNQTIGYMCLTAHYIGAGMCSGAGADTSSSAGSSPKNDFWVYIQST